MSDVQERIIKIIKGQLEEIMPGQEIELEYELKSLGINSILFIKTTVYIEDEFGIEFPDEDLDFNRFITIKDLCDYVSSKYEKDAI